MLNNKLSELTESLTKRNVEKAEEILRSPEAYELMKMSDSLGQTALFHTHHLEDQNGACERIARLCI